MKEIVNHTENESKRKTMKEGSKSDILRSSRLGKDWVNQLGWHDGKNMNKINVEWLTNDPNVHIYSQVDVATKKWPSVSLLMQKMIWNAISVDKPPDLNCNFYWQNPSDPQKEEEKEVLCTKISIFKRANGFSHSSKYCSTTSSQRSSHVQEIPGEERERESFSLASLSQTWELPFFTLIERSTEDGWWIVSCVDCMLDIAGYRKLCLLLRSCVDSTPRFWKMREDQALLRGSNSCNVLEFCFWPTILVESERLRSPFSVLTTTLDPIVTDLTIMVFSMVSAPRGGEWVLPISSWRPSRICFCREYHFGGKFEDFEDKRSQTKAAVCGRGCRRIREPHDSVLNGFTVSRCSLFLCFSLVSWASHCSFHASDTPLSSRLWLFPACFRGGGRLWILPSLLSKACANEGCINP